VALLLVALFVVLPFVELALIVAAADSFGLGVTFLALILFSVAGGWLMRREGWAVWRRANEELGAGRVPTTHLLDGAMVLGGGALLLTPGFLTDAVGLLLLLPPSRALLRPLVLRAMTRRIRASAGRARVTGVWVGGRGPGFPGRVVDAEATEAGRPAASARVVRVEPLRPDEGPDALEPRP
jgi:UPF0716 protein FxsA